LTGEKLDNLIVKREDFLKGLKIVQPSAKREGFTTIPKVTWDEVGALDKIREELSLSILMPIRQHSLFKQIGINPHSGVLLYGPPGILNHFLPISIYLYAITI
jgi:ribosome biogenesis ATPase